jgi:hypothetical protein
MDFPLQSVRVGKNVCGLVRRGLVIDATDYRCIIRAANKVTNLFDQQVPGTVYGTTAMIPIVKRLRLRFLSEPRLKGPYRDMEH